MVDDFRVSEWQYAQGFPGSFRIARLLPPRRAGIYAPPGPANPPAVWLQLWLEPKPQAQAAGAIKRRRDRVPFGQGKAPWPVDHSQAGAHQRRAARALDARGTVQSLPATVQTCHRYLDR
jgi:hypothetical protein